MFRKQRIQRAGVAGLIIIVALAISARVEEWTKGLSSDFIVYGQTGFPTLDATVHYDYFTPLVVRADRAEPVLFSAKITGFQTRVALQVAGDEWPMLDDGSGGDVSSGDGIYTVTLQPSQVVRLQPDDVFRTFVGFLHVYIQNTRVFRGNVFAEVVTDEIPPAAVMPLDSSSQTSSYVFNLIDSKFVTGEDPDVSRVTKKFYQHFRDDFDFLIVVSTLSQFRIRHRLPVKNDTLGIGAGMFNNSANYGSSGKLAGITVFPISGFFDGAETGYQHELGHQWINLIPRRPFDSGTPHWPISTLASGIMGFSISPSDQGGDYPCELVPESGGIRLMPRTGPPVFKDLDLYLMGLIPASAVGEHIVFSDQNQGRNLPCDGRLTTAPTTRVGITDITNVVGRRIPDSTYSPKRFKIGTIFVSKDTLLSPDEMRFYSFFAARAQETKEVRIHSGFYKAVEKPFALSTGGKGSLDARLRDVGSDVYTLPDRVSVSLSSQGSANSPVVGYGRVVPDIGHSAPAGFAIFGLRQNGIFVTEATVPASPARTSGRFFAEIGGGVNTGIAIVNPNNRNVTLTFHFAGQDGQWFGEGSIFIAANTQISKFLDQDPFNGGTSVLGTFTFTASAPVAVTALRGYINERSEFLITTLPVADTTVPPTEPVMFPHFADGGGWTTQFALVNSTAATMVGRLEFYSAGATSPELSAGVPVEVTIGGQTATSFNYSIPGGTARSFLTSGGPALQTGSVRMTPGFGTFVPTAVAIFRHRPNSVTVTESGVPAIPSATAYRMYVETAGNFNDSVGGSMQSGLAIANSSPNPVTVRLDLLTLAGVPAGLTGTLTIPANGQVAKFLGQIDGFGSLPESFQGMLRVSTSASAVTMAGLRGRYNERREFIVTTIQPVSESAASPNTTVFFPQIVDGGGYATQFVLMNGTGDVPISYFMHFSTQTGAAMNLPLR